MNVLINRLSSEHEQALRSAITEWGKICSEESADRTVVEESIAFLYNDLNMSAPTVIWCDSIAQLVAVHGLVPLLKVTDPVFLPSLSERFSQIQDPWWQNTVEVACRVAGLEVLPSWTDGLAINKPGKP